MHVSLLFRCAAVGVAALAVTGCVTRDKGADLAVALPSRWSSGATAGNSQPPADLANWWRRFRDPQIDRLVQSALASNPGLDEARERVIAARALARAQGAQRLPIVDGAAAATVTSRLSGPAGGLNAAGEDYFGDSPRRTVGTFQAGFDARWELDFFGRLSSAANAAERAAEVITEEAREARLSLAAEVVRTYFELRGALGRRAVIQREIMARQNLVSLVRAQQVAGSSGEFDVQRARATYEAARARAPAADLAVRTALHRLATLTGSTRADQSLLRGGRSAGYSVPAIGPVPATILRWRSDIRRAEQLILQRGAEADVAYAELFPRFNLAGTLDIAGNLIARPILGTPITLSGGPGVTIPLFDWGMRNNVLRAREAQWREAVAGYRGTVLRAVEDVEISLATIRTTRARVDRQRTAVSAANSAFTLADRQYRGGLTGLTERLQAETDLRQAELDLAEASEQAAVANVGLFKALGAPAETVSVLPPAVVPDGASPAGPGIPIIPPPSPINVSSAEQVRP